MSTEVIAVSWASTYKDTVHALILKDDIVRRVGAMEHNDEWWIGEAGWGESLDSMLGRDVREACEEWQARGGQALVLDAKAGEGTRAIAYALAACELHLALTLGDEAVCIARAVNLLSGTAGGARTRGSQVIVQEDQAQILTDVVAALGIDSDEIDADDGDGVTIFDTQVL